MKREDLARAMVSMPLFSSLDLDRAMKLVNESVLMEHPKGRVLSDVERPDKGLNILLEGRIKLYRVSDEGRAQTIYVFEPGEPFCLCSVFSRRKNPGNLETMEPSTVLFIPLAVFERLLADDPGVSMAVIRILSGRLSQAMGMIESLALKQTPSRIAGYLLAHHSDGVVRLKYSQREWAMVLGITPEALSRALKRMAGQGLIEQGKGVIKILSLENLESCGDLSRCPGV